MNEDSDTSNMPATHPLRPIPLRRERGRHELKPYLSFDVALDRSGNIVAATGVPMNVHILTHGKHAVENLETLRNGMRDTVLDCLRERDYECGNITPATIQSTV